MAYKLERREAVLKFDADTPLSGAEVTTALDVPIRQFLSLQRRFEDKEGNASDRSEALFAAFADAALVSWNIEDADGPIPATAEGIMNLPFEHANALIDAWLGAVVGGSPNSASGSKSGEQSQGLSATTEAA